MLYWKWKLFGALDCPAMEYYFEKMAAKGWMLKKFYGGFCGFEKCEPKKVRFQVAILGEVSLLERNNNEKSLDFREYCQTAGWNYICADKFMQFLWTEYPDVVPIETDEELKLEAAKKQQNKLMVLNFPWAQALAFLVGFLFMDFGIFEVFFLQAFKSDLLGFAICSWYFVTFLLGISNLIVYNLWIKYSEKQAGESKKVWYFNWRAYRIRAFFEWLNIGFALMMIGAAVVTIFREYKLWAAILWISGVLAYTGFIIWQQFQIRKKGTNAGIIVLLCVSIWFYNTLKGAVVSGIDPGLYKKEAEEVVSLTEEQAFIHERDLGIYAEEPIDRYGIKDHTYWESWENYSIRERKGNEEWSPAIFYYNMSCSDYGWILNLEQNMAMHATKELQKQITETWMNGVWVRSGPYSKDDTMKRTMIFRCDKVLVQLDYMSDRTSMGEKEIMEYVTEKVREKAEAME